MNVLEWEGLLIKKISKLFLLALHMIFWKYSGNFGYKNETRNSSCLPVLIKYRAQLEPRQGCNDAVGIEAGCLPLKACKLFSVRVVWILGVLSDSLLSLDDWAASQKYLLTSLALWEFHPFLPLRPQYPLHLLPDRCVITASCFWSWV